MRGRPPGRSNTIPHIWTDKEKEYLKKITPGNHHKEIQKLLNEECNTDFTLEQIKGAISRYKLTTGFTGQFGKMHIPFNKDKKGVCAKGSEKGWFKKGTIPPNHDIIGTEKITVDGYTTVKVAEPNKWRLKQQLVWEKYNGLIKKGYVVIFGDGNRQNLEINNLILVSRQQLLILNKNKLIQKDAELTRTGVIIADLYQKISKIKRDNI